jgi:2,4-dienoyl-CoA reductase-like NADH-dependent reductase (Old Yellow Enzyme family)
MAEDGLPASAHIGYYRERGARRRGMIVVEPVPIHRTAVLTRGNFRRTTTRSSRRSARDRCLPRRTRTSC